MTPTFFKAAEESELLAGETEENLDYLLVPASALYRLTTHLLVLQVIFVSRYMGAKPPSVG